MINQVTLVGRLTKDPEVRYTPEGKAVANVTLAVSRNFRDQAGEYKTDFVYCILWGRQAENTALYCNKGSIVGITGRIATRKYENAEQKTVYSTEIVAENVQFLDKKRKEELSEEMMQTEECEM
ncbi:MAG: single-stranded DNA-binding protein [Bacillales bacterium]|nr:single-stranded DNA-binding protein [Bacillales bacterium]